MKRLSATLTAGALAAVLVTGCVVGDGDVLTVDPPFPCRLYPDDPQKCWALWTGHIIQSCGEGNLRPTTLYFDRPDVADSLRVNVINVGSLPVISPHFLVIDTGTVCDAGVCRNLVTEIRVYDSFPGHRVTGYLDFWEPELYRDSLMMYSSAGGGGLVVDSVWRESCP